MATPPEPLALQDGFAAGVFAEGLQGIRMLAVASNGDVLATIPKSNRIVALPDRDGDGAADRVAVFDEAGVLNEPHGIAIRGEWLYVANTDSVWRYAYVTGDLSAREPPEVVVPSIPGGPQHWTRTILFSADERMILSVGSSCDVCVEDNPLRAALLRFDADGGNASVVARGLRNAVGLAVNPQTEEVWMTENGRDLLGDNLPPDELNVLREGADYGWPFCFGRQVPDPEMGATAETCAATEPAAVEIPAHSAPLGVVFYDGDAFPDEYRGDAFVAYHGSWNRSRPTGYKVVRIPFTDGQPSGPPEDFAWGWLKADTTRWGRPVDVKQTSDGSLLVTDDFAGRVFRIAYAPVEPTPTPWR
jgi:glucose/arabinose dehydrogenase